jgi:DNA-binding XRE family transcriptional regulator
MSEPTAALGDIKARIREALAARIRARLERVRVALTPILKPKPGASDTYLSTGMYLNIHTHRLTHISHGRSERDTGPWEEEREITFLDGLAQITAEAEDIVAHTVSQIWERVHSPLIAGNLRRAVLSREELSARWPWDEHHEASAVLLGLIECVEPMLFLQPHLKWIDEPIPYRWPEAYVAPLALADWIEPLLKREREAITAFRTQSQQGWRARRVELWGEDWGVFDLRWRALAVLYAVKQAVEKDRAKQAMAIDAGRPHHDLLTRWRDLPKDPRTPYDALTINDRIQLIARDGTCVQLELDLDGQGSPSVALIHGLRRMRSWEGLRHWAAVQKLLSVDGGRKGWVRWTLNGHLKALGISMKNRSRAALRAQYARAVEAFTRIEIAVYAQDGTLRSRRPLLLVGAKYDRLKGSVWELDGMQLMINPLLYSGVREAGGKLGSNWHPAPVELAQVDHIHHPYTLALGLILPIRWRLALQEDREFLTLTGESALNLAAIPYTAYRWDALERDLTELQRIGGLGRWEWDAADTPRTPAGRLHLWPAQWMIDRTQHEVRPQELPPGPAVLTGGELKIWRTRKGLTQAKAAKTLDMSRWTIARAEAHPLEPISTALAAKIRGAGA